MSTPAPLTTRTLTSCLACGSTKWHPLPLRYEFRGTFPAAACDACGMRFLQVQPDDAGLIELYSAAYFEQDFRCGRSAVGYFDESAFRPENEDLLKGFEALTAGRRLLEVGCAGGWLLKHATERGWRARGVELSKDAVAHARGLGLDVFLGTLDAAALPAASCDLVYMGDVLEHVPDCRATLAEVVRVLAPDGVLYLRGPITTNSLARGLALSAAAALGRTLILREPPYHLWEFTPGSLGSLAVRAGLRVERMRQSKIPPGRAHGRKTPLERLAMAAIDVLNVPLTGWFNVRGDRVVMIARRPQNPG